MMYLELRFGDELVTMPKLDVQIDKTNWKSSDYNSQFSAFIPLKTNSNINEDLHKIDEAPDQRSRVSNCLTDLENIARIDRIF